MTNVRCTSHVQSYKEGAGHCGEGGDGDGGAFYLLRTCFEEGCWQKGCVCPYGGGWEADMAGGEARRSILYVPDLINFNPSSSRKGVIEMHI